MNPTLGVMAAANVGLIPAVPVGNDYLGGPADNTFAQMYSGAASGFGGCYYHGGIAPYGTSWGVTTTDIISLLFDVDNGKLYAWTNGVNNGILASTIGTDAPFANSSIVLTAGADYVICASKTGVDTLVDTINGSGSFAYTMPVGYKPWNATASAAGMFPTFP